MPILLHAAVALHGATFRRLGSAESVGGWPPLQMLSVLKIKHASTCSFCLSEHSRDVLRVLSGFQP